MNARMLISASGIALAGALAAIEPAQAALTLIAVGGGGGGDGFLAGGAGGVISESGTSGGTGAGAGGTGGLGGAGVDGGGGAGWLGNGGSVAGGGGSSAPTFAGGVGFAGNGAGGFGGGGGSGSEGGGGGGGYSGGGGSGFVGSLGAGGGGGGGGSYLNPGMRDTIETPDFNGVPGPFTGSNANNGYVIVGLTVFNYTGTVVEYTIPTTGFYYVAAVGAQGGLGFFTGGFGAGVGGSVFLDMGTELDIVVGGAGATSVNGLLNGGGGGGSFVWDPIAVPPQPVTAAVPEPSTWAMMLLGFGGLGFLGWRGSRKTTARSA